ncbi:hypothetical protein [Bacteroides fragilis]|uniref:hypothetical protein n=1 Tax=Bacteroides fragilis TaxID=817 RepID=UPI002454859D|nr:hypothetical protein [Bacteroides fragilis]
MLNAYINKDDILKILNEIDSIGSFVNRSEFQKRIGRLKGVKPPKEKPVCDIRIKNRKYLINEIMSILDKARKGEIKTNFELYCESHLGCKLYGEKYRLVKLDNITKAEIYDLNAHGLVIDRDYIMEILHISKPTLLRLIKILIINQHAHWVNLYIGNTLKKRVFCIYCYDLEEVLSNLNN